jgi:molybdopterin synthase catalytic subunit
MDKTIAAVQEEDLDLNQLVKELATPDAGAVCIFTGLVRAVTSGETTHRTEYLEYEAYLPMAEEKCVQVAEEIRERWPAVRGVAVIQRVGKLLPEEPTVAVVCTAGHRDTGVFEAARYGIDRLKEIVPVWKKEVGPEGESWVEGNYSPEPGE